MEQFVNGQSVSSVETVKVYPNPATDYIIIQGLTYNAKAEIFTLTGQKVVEKAFDIETKIDLDINTGIYLVKISNDKKEIYKKIVVN